MHIAANTNYDINGYFYKTIIPSFSSFVYVFMMISGFGMSVGYLDKFQCENIDLEKFYKKRYKKILPFFLFLIIIALIIEPSLNNIFEVSIEVLLLNGFLPNNSLNVLGVCWTLGVIFVFYLLFPCFSVLMKTKKRAWIAFIISIWINFVCSTYFFKDMYVIKSFSAIHSFIYCMPLFIVGGIIYLYRNTICEFCEKNKGKCLIGCVTITICRYYLDRGTIFSFYIKLIFFTAWLIYTIGVSNRILNNKFMKFFSGI